MSKTYWAPIFRVSVVGNCDANRVVLFTVECPHCGKKHTHGGGNDLDVESVRTFLGDRAAHCGNWGGYSIYDHYGLLPLKGKVRSARKPNPKKEN